MQKVIVLIQASKKQFEELTDSLGEKASLLLVDTEHCDEDHEQKYFPELIKKFIQSNKQIMLTKFSGRTSTVQFLGDEFSEMIVCFSYNKHNRFYNKNVKRDLTQLLCSMEQQSNNENLNSESSRNILLNLLRD